MWLGVDIMAVSYNNPLTVSQPPNDTILDGWPPREGVFSSWQNMTVCQPEKTSFIMGQQWLIGLNIFHFTSETVIDCFSHLANMRRIISCQAIFLKFSIWSCKSLALIWLHKNRAVLLWALHRYMKRFCTDLYSLEHRCIGRQRGGLHIARRVDRGYWGTHHNPPHSDSLNTQNFSHIFCLSVCMCISIYLGLILVATFCAL